MLYNMCYVQNGEVSYLVHWAGYTSGDETWERQENLEDCQELLNAFLAKVMADSCVSHCVCMICNWCS